MTSGRVYPTVVGVTESPTEGSTMNEELAARISLLRAWAAFNDRAMEAHGTADAVSARTMANSLADELGDFTEADWGIIRLAQRGYLAESQS